MSEDKELDKLRILLNTVESYKVEDPTRISIQIIIMKKLTIK